MRNKGVGAVMDVYTLRESFRGAAKREQYDNPEFVGAFLASAREFENLLTHYYHEHPELPENRAVLAQAEKRLVRMAAYAFALNAGSIVVPVPAESPDAQLVGRMVRNNRHLPVKVLLPVR
jgi:hypothetical protein